MAAARAGPPETSAGALGVGPRLTMVELAVADSERSAAWYRQHLGLRVLLRQPEEGYALLDAGGARLALKQVAPGPTGMVPVSSGGVGRAMLLFEVADVAKELERLTAVGAAVIKPLRRSLEGYRRAVVADPDGHWLTLYDFLPEPGAAATGNDGPAP
ncbi:MAG TPA: VOC family protein [Gemmatales bacterium]|nr:VOC family protein [Gemmatales bacterium]HMP60773.1 VOC family protein [Gemmatales bacterium]